MKNRTFNTLLIIITAITFIAWIVLWAVLIVAIIPSPWNLVAGYVMGAIGGYFIPYLIIEKNWRR